MFRRLRCVAELDDTPRDKPISCSLLKPDAARRMK
jgi:hypothetical protein